MVGDGNGRGVGVVGVEDGVGFPGPEVFVDVPVGGCVGGGSGGVGGLQLTSIPPAASSTNTTANNCNHLRRLRLRCATALSTASGPNNAPVICSGRYGFAPPPGVKNRPVTGS